MSGSRAVRWYGRLLRLLPRSFREEAGAELVETFAAAHVRASRRGRFAVWSLWARAVADLVVTARAERRQREPFVSSRERRTMTERLRLWTADLRSAARHLRSKPGSALLAAGTLALGLAAALSAFVLVRDILLEPLPFPGPERLVRLREQNDGEGQRRFWPSFPTCADWEARATSFTALGCASIPEPTVVFLDSRGVMADVARGTAGLFRALGVQPVAGRLFSANEHRAGGPAVAVVRRGFWQNELGERPFETITLAIGAERVPIAGVLPDDFRFLGDASDWSRADVWMPLERETNLGGRQSHGYHTVGRLRPGIDLVTAEHEMAELAAVLKAEHGEPTNADRAELRPLTGVVLRRAEQPVRLLGWAAAAVLLVAVINFAATLFARGVARRHELSVRLSLGARRGDVARLHVAEALVLAVPAALAGLLGAAAAIRAMTAMYPGILPRFGQVRFDAPAAGLGILLGLGSATVAACLPALLLSARSVAGHLAARGDAGAPGHRYVWNLSLAAQAGAALVLLVASGLLVQSFRAALQVDVGYRADDVLTVAVVLPESRYPSADDRRAFILDALGRLEELPSAVAVSMTNVLPHVTQAMISGTYPAGDQAAFVFAGHRVVTPDFFPLLGIPIQPGAETLRPGSVYVDMSLGRRFWADRSPLGQSIGGGFAGRGTTVSGVVGSVREWNHDMGAIGTVYYDYRQTAFDLDSGFLLVRHRGDVERAEREIRQALSAVAPDLPIEVASLDRQMRDSLADRRAVLQLVSAFSVIGLVIASAGIYALVAFSVGRRLREAAIRKAVGAQPSQVALTMVRAGVGPAIAGVAMGLVAWIPASDVLRALLFEVAPFDPVILAAAAVVLIAASVVASAVPARRAATVEPVVLLRD